MKKTLVGLMSAAAVAVGLAAAGGASPAVAADPLKVGFVYVGPASDFGWSYQHDVGRKAVEEAFGDKVQTAFVENVQEGADAERVIRQFAASGFDLVFTTSFGFMNPTLKVAQQFPKVKFEHATGYKRADNVATYAARFYEGRYVIGVIAGLMTKSNTIGYVASFPIPEVVSGINAFTQGLRSVNPNAQVKVIWVNSWYDPPREREAAETLVAQGADVLSQHTDSPAPIQVAEEKGIHAFGQSTDMLRFGPHAQLTAIVDNWSDYYKNRIQMVMDGAWKSEDTWGGLASDMVHLSPYNTNELSPEIVAKAEEARTAIVNGTLHPFDGPLVNQAGETVLPAGQSLPDEKILSMDWYVQGVQGELPK
ncbi:BMP family ABC transporter substrate-binding protein [Pararhodospirillum oryzae]|uniref:BMP family ABC transporter substrate-binding protein n=1 Tax=Pararhodospirillum oryzae TaxID=478448 RepID=A0A512H3D7_9PROT|nr:BMP family ABC transporter substrate-binding protein [Pararhodospirillum oryzae]GEO79928.1 BMP family ABC transporter substrate-binding protein [Pararhodospirillum oryzae]